MEDLRQLRIAHSYPPPPPSMPWRQQRTYRQRRSTWHAGKLPNGVRSELTAVAFSDIRASIREEPAVTASAGTTSTSSVQIGGAAAPTSGVAGFLTEPRTQTHVDIYLDRRRLPQCILPGHDEISREGNPSCSYDA